MSQAINMTTVKIPRQKGKVNGKTISKGKYVEYHVREWLRHNLGVITDRDLSELSSAIANLLIRVIGGGSEVKLSVVVKYNGVITIDSVKRSYFHFDLYIYVGDKRINVYTFIKKRPEIFVDNSVDYFANSDFVDIANFVVYGNSVMPRFDMPDNFADIANYVMDYVMTYGKKRKREINVYAYANSIREFLAFLNEYTDIFNDRELRELIGKRYVYYWYRYLRNSGYFTVYHGDIE
jgi:hypothetical protein